MLRIMRQAAPARLQHRRNGCPDSCQTREHSDLSAPQDPIQPPALTPALALAPILFLIALLACSVYLFGSDSSYGANQVALVLASCVAALVGRRVGISWHQAQEGIVRGITLGLGPTLILLSVGMLIGTWILCGTVPSMIYYGVQILNPAIFYAASAAICAADSHWSCAPIIRLRSPKNAPMSPKGLLPPRGSSPGMSTSEW